MRLLTMRRVEFYLRRYATRNMSLDSSFDSLFAISRESMCIFFVGPTPSPSPQILVICCRDADVTNQIDLLERIEFAIAYGDKSMDLNPYMDDNQDKVTFHDVSLFLHHGFPRLL